MSSVGDASPLAAEAAGVLLRRWGIPQLDAALVLGSGWATAAEGLGAEVGSLDLATLPGFHAPAVDGHGRTLTVVRSGAGRLVALFHGRTHLYEGCGVDAVVHAVRVAAAAGATRLVLTNGCGSVRPRWGAGTPVLISDHINLTGATPLVGPRFIDLSDAYSPALRDLARRIDPALEEGVYVQFHGPAYETPAEVRMAAALGGDLVGMSTALECVAARDLGLEVLGISLVTNAAAGLGCGALHHDEVIAAGRAAVPRLRTLLAGLVEAL